MSNCLGGPLPMSELLPSMEEGEQLLGENSFLLGKEGEQLPGVILLPSPRGRRAVARRELLPSWEGR